jgi:hypothetical protein
MNYKIDAPEVVDESRNYNLRERKMKDILCSALVEAGENFGWDKFD